MSQSEVPEAPAYTQLLPTKSGYYWVLFSFDRSPLMEYLIVEDGVVYSFDSDFERQDYALTDENWYAGPIPVPELPQRPVASSLLGSKPSVHG